MIVVQLHLGHVAIWPAVDPIRALARQVAGEQPLPFFAGDDLSRRRLPLGNEQRRALVSHADIEMTREIGTSAGALGIAIHDHLVIGRKGHASFRSLGLLIPSAMPSIADAEHEDNGVEVVVRWPELT